MPLMGSGQEEEFSENSGFALKFMTKAVMSSPPGSCHLFLQPFLIMFLLVPR